MSLKKKSCDFPSTRLSTCSIKEPQCLFTECIFFYEPIRWILRWCGHISKCLWNCVHGQKNSIIYCQMWWYFKHSSHVQLPFLTKQLSVGQRAEFAWPTEPDAKSEWGKHWPLHKIPTVIIGFHCENVQNNEKCDHTFIQQFFVIFWIFIEINWMETQLLTWCNFLSAFCWQVNNLNRTSTSGFSHRPFVLSLNSCITARPFQGQFQRQKVFSIRSTIAAQALWPLTLSSVPNIW